MAADEVQRLELKDLDAVLERAKAEEWTELALVASSAGEPKARGLLRTGWPGAHVFQMREPLRHVPVALGEINSLKTLNLAGNQIRDAGAIELTRLWIVSHGVV